MFLNRQDAGQKLGRRLAERHVQVDQVLGLPRGGVVVAGEIARLLGVPLDVLVVRKIGHPRFREFAVGAMAEDGTRLLDKGVLERSQVTTPELDEVLQEETRRLAEYRLQFHRQAAPLLKGKRVMIVDDGLATGATAEVAALSAKKQLASQVIMVAPVASDKAFERLARIVDDVIVLQVDPAFEAVGQYYHDFRQTTDEAVQKILDAAR